MSGYLSAQFGFGIQVGFHSTLMTLNALWTSDSPRACTYYDISMKYKGKVKPCKYFKDPWLHHIPPKFLLPKMGMWLCPILEASLLSRDLKYPMAEEEWRSGVKISNLQHKIHFVAITKFSSNHKIRLEA